MTDPVAQPTEISVDETHLKGLEAQHDLVFGKEGWRYPALQTMRTESLARSVIALVHEIRSLRAQLATKEPHV